MIHVPISVYVFTSSQTPSSSPFDEEHGMFGTQAAYTAAMPVSQGVNSGGADALRRTYQCGRSVMLASSRHPAMI